MTRTMSAPTSLRTEHLLVAVVDAMAAEVPVDLEGVVSLERTRVLLVQAERIKALALQGLSDVEARQLHTLDGSPTASAWVRAQDVAGVTPRDVTMARRLRQLPQVEAELLAGRLSAEAAALVTTAVGKARPFLDRLDGLIDGLPAEDTLYGVLVDGIASQLAEQTGGTSDADPEQMLLRTELEMILEAGSSELARLEAGFVLLAQRSMPGMLRSTLALLLDALLPAEHDKRARKAEDERGVQLSHRHGGSGWHLSGDLDDETGELLDTALRAQKAVDPDNPVDTDAWRAAEGEDLTDLEPDDWPQRHARPRSRKQQSHGAFRGVLRTMLGSGALGVRDKAVPHIAIAVDLDFVQGVPGALPGRSLSGARWSREQVRRLLCAGSFTRLVLDAKRRVVESVTPSALSPLWKGRSCISNGAGPVRSRAAPEVRPEDTPSCRITPRCSATPAPPAWRTRCRCASRTTTTCTTTGGSSG